MNNALQIHLAQPEDVPALQNLVNDAFRGKSAKQGWTTEIDLVDGDRTDETLLHEMMRQPQSALFKGLNEANQLIGCVYLQKRQNQVYLGMLTVSPEVQAKGIGSQLLKASEQWAREQDCRSIIMTVVSVRTELIDWYIRHGYHPTGEIKPFPADPRFGIPKQPLEVILLEKVLS